MKDTPTVTEEVAEDVADATAVEEPVKVTADSAAEEATEDGTDSTGQPTLEGVIRSRLGWGRIAAAAVIALLAATAGWAGWQWKQAEDLASARAQALDAARHHAVVVASYDHRDFDGYVEEVSDLATGDFADQFAETNKDMREVMKQTKAQVEATVVDAGVQSASDDEAVVLLLVDQRGASSEGESTDRVVMRMTLVRSGGEWLVSEIARP